MNYILLNSKSTFILFLLICSFEIYGQSKVNEINTLELKIENLKTELKASELKLRKLKFADQKGYNSISIDYSDKYIVKILNNLAPLEFRKKNNSWDIFTIDYSSDSLLKIPIEDAYGLESFSEFWDLKKDKKYQTIGEAYLTKIVCENSSKEINIADFELHNSHSNGYITAYVYNCSDKIVNSLKVSVEIKNFTGDKTLTEDTVDLLKYGNLKPHELKKIDVSYIFSNKLSGFLHEYDYKILQ